MRRIEDYAMIGNCRTAALVHKSGSIDWLCLPYFNSPACFTALLGTKDHGHWTISPKRNNPEVERSYRKDSLSLETSFSTPDGKVILTDCMAISDGSVIILRTLEGIEGEVEMTYECVPRFEYGQLIPLFLKKDDGTHLLICGPDKLRIGSAVELKCSEERLKASFTIKKGDKKNFHLVWSPSHLECPHIDDVEKEIKNTEKFWAEWVATTFVGERTPHYEVLERSMIILKAMTFEPSGSLVAAVTTSLPETIGEGRNWDYRFCWPRDAALAIHALVSASDGLDEIDRWRKWLMRASSGVPEQMQPLYGLFAESAAREEILDWLPGFLDSKPVRIGNAAKAQLQLDTFVATIEAFYKAEKLGLPRLDGSWELVDSILTYLEEKWQEPDEGIWEIRGERRHFVHSKAMVWGAYHYAIKACKELHIEGQTARWIKNAERIKHEVLEKGFDKKLNSFVQYYGSKEVDASLLMLPIIGFLEANDPMIEGTVKRIEEELSVGKNLIMRYLPNEKVEGLPESGERAFLICSGWLGKVYALQGKMDKAQEVLDTLVSLTNDVGLLSEQFDAKAKRQLGNFPQAFSHIGLVLLELAIKKG